MVFEHSQPQTITSGHDKKIFFFLLQLCIHDKITITHFSTQIQFSNLFIVRGHSTREPASNGCDNEEGDLLYSASHS